MLKLTTKERWHVPGSSLEPLVCPQMYVLELEILISNSHAEI